MNNKIELCTVCKINPIKMKCASVCSLKCACYINGDNYETIMANMRIVIAESKAGMVVKL